MIYDDTDYSTLEREAWQRGDYSLSNALGLYLDAEQQATEAQTLADEKETEAERLRDSLEDAVLRVERLETMIENAERVSERSAIMAELASLLDWLKSRASA